MITWELTELFAAERGGGIGGRRLIKLETGKPVEGLGWRSMRDAGREDFLRKQRQDAYQVEVRSDRVEGIFKSSCRTEQLMGN